MTRSAFHARFLVPEDVSALMDLEHSKWEPQQMADRKMMLQRIAAFPELSIGTFCTRTGQALASLFMCPVNPAIFTAPTKWESAAHAGATCAAHACGHSLFGISLSSHHPDAVKAIFKFFYPRALKAGWRDVYLGSPIPGFRKARQKKPDLSVWEYVHAKRNLHPNEPLDPQLKYYFTKGFTQIVSIQENYFPHAESLNYGVILRSAIPLSRPRHLWRITPLSVIESLAAMGLWLSSP